MRPDRTGQTWWDWDGSLFVVVGPSDPDAAGIPCYPVVNLLAADLKRPGERGWKREYDRRPWETQLDMRRIA